MATKSKKAPAKAKAADKSAAEEKAAEQPTGAGQTRPERSGQTANAAGQPLEDVNPQVRAQNEKADASARKAGLPPAHSLPPDPRGGVRGNTVADRTGVVFQLPQVAPGRFALTDQDAEEPDEKLVAERAKELLKEKDRVPAGTAAQRAEVARDLARSELMAEAVLDSEKAEGTRVGVTREEAEEKEARRQVDEQAIRGADFVNNPRAYAAEPENPLYQGPAEPVPVDYRRIQDLEGRLAGNWKAPA